MAKQTLVITNFSGRLTRVLNGDLNSGFAKYDTSWGYNPFFKPGNLTWFKTPTDISAIITDSSLVLAAKSRWESGTYITYAISDTGKLWKITTTASGSSGTNPATLSAGSPTFAYGADLDFYNGKIWITNDKGVSRIDFDGTNETAVGTWDTSHFVQNTYHPLQTFGANLYVGNSTDGTNPNIAEIGTSNTVLAYSKLSPAFPVGVYVRDLDITPDYTYLVISNSRIPVEATAPVNDTANGASSDSDILMWNGSDTGATTGTSLPSFGITALNTFGGSKYAFMYDAFGASLYDGTKKKLSLRNCKSPYPNATFSSGNFISWMVPENIFNLDSDSTTIKSSLFYYGSLDDEVGLGLWRPFQGTAAGGSQIYQTPMNMLVTNRYISQSSGGTNQVDSNGTHMFSFSTYNGSATTKKLNTFDIAPPDNAPGGWGGAVAGVYETQNQLFSKKQAITQMRVYTEPTVSGNGFQIDLIGSGGKKVANSQMTYTFASGTSETALQGALERINFNPAVDSFYSLGLRITNTGSNNMCIRKVELDIDDSGR